MTKNRAHKRSAKALAAKADVRHPDAFYLADTRKLRTAEWGMINFAEGPLRLLGTDAALNHYRPLEVVLQAAAEKKWRIVQLTTLDTRSMPDILAYIREEPTLTMLHAAHDAPTDPLAVELLSGVHKDLNVAVQDATNSRAWHDLFPGRIITFSVKDGGDLEPIPPRINEWRARVDRGNAAPGSIHTIEWEPKDSPEVLCGPPAATQLSDDFATAVSEAMKAAPDEVFIGNPTTPVIFDGHPSVFSRMSQLSGADLNPRISDLARTDALESAPPIDLSSIGSDPGNLDPFAMVEKADAAPASIITGRPGTGRTAEGWARVEAADAVLDALRIPQEAREFCRYPDGLFLITGPTCTGKTTTGLALMRRAQVERGAEAFVIMRPGEALGPRQGPRLGPAVLLPVFGEGEYPGAIREAVERGAEILFVDGLHDREAIKAAVDASLSGVLVFATMHPRPEEALERLQDEFQGDGAAEAHDRVRQAVRGVIGVQLVDGEGPERRALTAEVWVKGDEEEAALEPVLTFAESHAAVTAKFAAIRAGSDTDA